MNLDLDQTAKILGKTSDEVLYIVQDKRLPAKIKMDADMKYNDDGTVSFVETAEKNVVWEFDLTDVLKLKEELDKDLDGTLKQILEG